jgi:hypothetical protein
MTTPDENNRIDRLVEAWAELLLASFRAAGVYLRKGYGLPPTGVDAAWIMPRAIARAAVLFGNEVGERMDMAALHVAEATKDVNGLDLCVFQRAVLDDPALAEAWEKASDWLVEQGYSPDAVLAMARGVHVGLSGAEAERKSE